MALRGYFINLDNAVERRAHMEAQIQGLSLPISRFPALDGTTLSEGDYTNIHKQAEFHRLSRAEVACFLSHRQCWRLISEAAEPFGAVFEDDVLFSKDSALFLSNTDWLRDQYDLIKVESTYRRVVLGRNGAKVNGREVQRLLTRHLGAGGYIVSRSFARVLVSLTENISLPVDYFLFDPRGATMKAGRVFQLNPAICIQQVRSKIDFLPANASRSDLDKDRIFLKVKGRKKIAREILRPFRLISGLARLEILAAREGGKVKLIKYENDCGR